MATTGGQCVVRTLRNLAVTTIFDLPGLHTLPIYDALYSEAPIRRIMAKHEGNASVMADAYGRITGRPGVALLAAGPGATNSVSGVAQAMVASSPLLHLTGTVPTRAPPSALHGLDDPDYLRKVFAPVSKLSKRVVRADEIPTAIVKGYSLAQTPRKGAVHIEFPLDVLEEGADCFRPRLPAPAPAGTRGPLASAMRLLRTSSNPVVFAGKSVPRERAVEALVAFVEEASCPAVVHSYYPDAFPQWHNAFAGDANEWSVDPIAELAFKEADLVLAIGVQWGSAETAFLRRFRDKPCIRVDVDSGYPSGVIPAVLSLTGGVKTIIERLSEAASEPLHGRGSLLRRIVDIKKRFRRASDRFIRSKSSAKPIHPGFLAATVAKVARQDGVLVLDGSSTSSWFLDVFARRNRSAIMWPGNYGSIGFAFPAGIGVQVAQPKKSVIVGTGDGGFLMSYMDMATAVENDLPLTVIVTNNRLYGDIWQIQRSRYGGRYIGTELHAVDFAGLARAFGGGAIRIEEPSQLEDACREALDSRKFTLLDVATDGKSSFLSEEVSIA